MPELLTPAARLAAVNQQAIERRDRFRADVAAGIVEPGGFQKLKHEFPYMGQVECSAGDLDFLLFHCNDDVVAWEYFWRGRDAYEPEIIATWIEWARQSNAVLDIGAYTGLMSILAMLANPKCHVHALEPVERTVERMKINFRINHLADRVTVHPRAAAAETGFEMLNYYRDEDFLGTGNSINEKGHKVMSRRLIQTVNVDQHLGSKHRFDLIKIDVEGYELEALKGLTRILRRDRPRLVVEVWKKTSAQVLKLLENLSYDCRRVEADLRPVNNYLCEPKS